MNCMRKGVVRLRTEKGEEKPVSLPYREAFLEEVESSDTK